MIFVPKAMYLYQKQCIIFRIVSTFEVLKVKDMNPVIQFIVEHAAECIVGAVILIAFGMLYWLLWRTAKSERREKPEKDAAIDPR